MTDPTPAENTSENPLESPVSGTSAAALAGGVLALAVLPAIAATAKSR